MNELLVQRTADRQRRPRTESVRAPHVGRRPTVRRATRRRLELVDARRLEAESRARLHLLLTRADDSYAFAARRLEEFEEYLSAVRKRLRQAGYLVEAPEPV
jgi:hypothetical protein